MKKNIPIRHEQVKNLEKGFYTTIVTPSRRMINEQKRRIRVMKREQLKRTQIVPEGWAYDVNGVVTITPPKKIIHTMPVILPWHMREAALNAGKKKK
jgi:hypothetical protein